MEMKDNGVKPLGFCHRLFNVFIKNIAFYTRRRRITLGRNHSAETEQEASKPPTVTEKDVKSEFLQSVDEAGEVLLVPPVFTIPVEQEEAKEKVNVADKPDYKNRKSVRIKSGMKEGGVLRDDEGQDLLKKRPSMGDTRKKGDNELKQKASLPPSQEKNEGEVSGVRPGKPVERSVSNIDKKSGKFIQEIKESFASDKKSDKSIKERKESSAS